MTRRWKLDQPIRSIPGFLSMRALNGLEKNGVTNLKELIQHSALDLSLFEGLGARSVIEIKSALEMIDLSLSPKPFTFCGRKRAENIQRYVKRTDKDVCPACERPY
jgi:hypothetical protein